MSSRNSHVTWGVQSLNFLNRVGVLVPKASKHQNLSFGPSLGVKNQQKNSLKTNSFCPWQ